MPVDNLSKIHFSLEQIQAIDDSLETIIVNLSEIALSLTPAERSKYGKVREQNKLLINKVKDYHENQPRLQSPEVDWAEFEKDYQDRESAGKMLLRLKTAETLLMNIKVLADYDNYSDALKDYQYAKYKNRFADQVGYSFKIDDLKVFFPNTGKKKKKGKDEGKK